MQQSSLWKCPRCGQQVIVVEDGPRIELRQRGRTISRCKCGQKKLNLLFREQRRAVAV